MKKLILRKRIITTYILLVGIAFMASAQVVLGDFESGGVIPGYSIEQSTLSALNIASNPLKNQLNNTNSALYLKTTDTNAPWWAGAKIDFNSAVKIDASTRYLHVLFKAHIPKFELVLFNNNNTDEKWIGQHLPDNQDWFDYVVDLSSLNGLNFSGFRIALHLSDSEINAQNNKELWVDEIILNNDPSPRALPKSNIHDITIDLSNAYQTIEGFSASDCWTGNYVGQYWAEPAKNAIAKYLFSQNKKSDGSPEGIGLSMWRVNLGAGTLEQGDDSNITDISRRAECFLDQNGNYDWTKQAGQQWFMNKAKDYGCESFVFFSNSPLVHYTRNGKGYASNDGNSNLRADKYEAFADYLATVAKHFSDDGFNITHISPVNEPQYDWRADGDGKAGQEGSPWHNSEIKKLVVELDRSIQEKNIGTKILIPEAGSWENLYKARNRAGNQINEFFNPSHTNYVGNLPSVAPIIAAHSYWTETTNNTLKNVRLNVKNNAENRNVKVYQTEWSLLSETGEGFPGTNTDFSHMDMALYMAKVIHADLAFANASSWSFWTSMDMPRWGHKNRFLLVALTPANNTYAPITESGTVEDTSTLWALGNYSYFVRPGYKRIQLSGADDLAGLMGTAYISPDKSKVVAVYVNMSYENKKVKTSFIGNNSLSPKTNLQYVTSSSYNLLKYGSKSSETYTQERELNILARSVSTIVFDMENNTEVKYLQAFKQMAVSPNPVKPGNDLEFNLPGNQQVDTGVVTLYTISGKVVMQETVNLNHNGFALKIPANLKDGVYFASLSTNSEQFYSKIIVDP